MTFSPGKALVVAAALTLLSSAPAASAAEAPEMSECQRMLAATHDWAAARPACAALAAAGDARAMFWLGEMHMRGKGGWPKNPGTAARLYRQAAERGDVWATYAMVAATAADPDASAPYLAAAVTLGHPAAMLRWGEELAERYYSKPGAWRWFLENIDSELLRENLRPRLAAHEDRALRRVLAARVLLGDEMEENPAEYIRRAAAAGHPHAMMKYGDLLLGGFAGGECAKPTGVAHSKTGAELAASRKALAKYFQEWGDCDIPAGVAMMKATAELGLYPRAALRWAHENMAGANLPRDRAEGLKWLLLLVEKRLRYPHVEVLSAHAGGAFLRPEFLAGASLEIYAKAAAAEMARWDGEWTPEEIAEAERRRDAFRPTYCRYAVYQWMPECAAAAGAQ